MRSYAVQPTGGRCCADAQSAPSPRALKVGAANDPLEHEASRAASAAIAGGAPPAGTAASSPGSSAPASVARTLAESGAPLDAATRSYFEPRFGRSFADVRVHEGPAAARASQALDAPAFTVGAHVAFGAGARAGANWLTAHELAHVAQNGGQADGVVRRGPPEGGAGVTIVSPIWDVDGRSVVVVESGGERKAFYRRSSSDLKGRAEGHMGAQHNQWAPFDGFSVRESTKEVGGKTVETVTDGYFEKNKYFGHPADDPRYSYGTYENRKIARALDKMALPQGEKTPWRAVQLQLQDMKVKVKVQLPPGVQHGTIIAKPPPETTPTRGKEGGSVRTAGGGYRGVASGHAAVGDPGEIVSGEIGGRKAPAPTPAPTKPPPVKPPAVEPAPSVKPTIPKAPLDLADYPPERKGPITRFFNDRPVLGQVGRVAANSGAQYISGKMLEKVMEHFFKVLEKARADFNANFPDVAALSGKAGLDALRAAYEQRLSDLSVPRKTRVLALAFVALTTPDKDRDAALAETNRRLASVKLGPNAVPDFIAAGEEFEAGMVDVRQELARLAAPLPDIAKDIHKRAAILTMGGQALEQTFWDLMMSPLAAFPLVYYELWSIHTVAQAFLDIGGRVSGFASEIDAREAAYRRLMDKLDADLLRVGDKVNEFLPPTTWVNRR